MKTIRLSLAVGVATLALAANSAFAHDTTKGAGRLLELSRGNSTRTLSEVSSKPLSTASRKVDHTTIKGATRQLELSKSRVLVDSKPTAVVSTRETTGVKRTKIVKGAARLVELTRNSRNPHVQIAPLK